MLVSIDRAGRVVIPKDLRDRLSIDAGTELDVDIDGDGIRLTPVRTRGRVIRDHDDGLPIIDVIPGFVTTDADVQRWRDAEQR
ncbi:MAG: AbrB/MazE/SpoVT family DNA-binding domain-containing protein [Acidimicrobiia bacterium]